MMNKSKKIVAIIAAIALVSILSACLVACNADDYRERLESKGYQVFVVKDNTDSGQYEWSVRASKGSGIYAESVVVRKFKTIDDAKEAEAEAKELIRNLNGYDVYRKGKIVISGTEQGVKDAK